MRSAASSRALTCASCDAPTASCQSKGFPAQRCPKIGPRRGATLDVKSHNGGHASGRATLGKTAETYQHPICAAWCSVCELCVICHTLENHVTEESREFDVFYDMLCRTRNILEITTGLLHQKKTGSGLSRLTELTHGKCKRWTRSGLLIDMRPSKVEQKECGHWGD
jgi:hypothetical protein